MVRSDEIVRGSSGFMRSVFATSAARHIAAIMDQAAAEGRPLDSVEGGQIEYLTKCWAINQETRPENAAQIEALTRSLQELVASMREQTVHPD